MRPNPGYRKTVRRWGPDTSPTPAGPSLGSIPRAASARSTAARASTEVESPDGGNGVRVAVQSPNAAVAIQVNRYVGIEVGDAEVSRSKDDVRQVGLAAFVARNDFDVEPERSKSSKTLRRVFQKGTSDKIEVARGGRGQGTAEVVLGARK